MNLKFSFFFLTHFCLKVNGQKLLMDVLPLIDAKVSYKDVLEVPGEAKSKLEEKVVKWFEDNNIELMSNKAIDNAHQILTGTHSIIALWGPNDFKELRKTVRFSIRITLRNERYQYEFSGFTVETPQQLVQLEIYQMDSKLSKYNKAFYKKIDTEIIKLIDTLKTAMAK